MRRSFKTRNFPFQFCKVKRRKSINNSSEMNSAEFVFFSRITEGIQVVPTTGIQKIIAEGNQDGFRYKLLIQSKPPKPLRCFLIFG